MKRLDIEYNSGRGHLAVDLDALLPCSAADFGRLQSFMDMSDHPEDHAAVIYEYISGKVAELREAREKLDPESIFDQKRIAQINAEIRKHASNAAQLSKAYGTPAVTDDAAKITFRAGTVYAIWRDPTSGKQIAKAFRGWTFCKSGFTFDVYKSGKAQYTVLLHGTGTKAASVASRREAAEAITPRVLDAIKKANLDELESVYRRCMIDAGFMEDDERPEIIPEAEQKKEIKEEKTMANYEFAVSKITIDGATYPAEYTIAKNGVVNVFAILSVEDDGRKHKKAVRIPQDYDEYPAAYDAAVASHAPDYRTATRAANEHPAPERSEIISEATPAAKIEAKPEPETPQPEVIYIGENGAPRDPKTTRGPVPEKTFVGSAIEGHGWKILFDGITSRTRVIFDGKPTDAARAATENAGFYYSPNMQSWNKKLTFKAYRAAQILSCTLKELYAA